MASNDDPQARVQELLRKLWEQHKETIFERLAELERLSASADELDDSARAELCAIAHKLAGSLGTFGFRQGSDWARDSERILLKPQIDSADQQQLRENARNIRTLIESPRAD
jgi:HPt (histidine-containing phosphotransfer) domain-containing protein